MKKNLKLWLAALVCTLFTQTPAMADNDKPVTVEQLPAAAQQFIKANFADRTVSIAKMESGLIEKSYDVLFTNGDRVEFDRNGNCIASYDKTHLFTPMGEHNFFEKGDHLCRFTLDGVSCAIIICYDIRFPELTRTLALGEGGLDVLFIVSQWPKVRTMHLRTLVRARAIENQMFTVCCNSCGLAGETQYAGSSLICDPWGEIIADAQTDSTDEKIIRADADMSIISGIRSSINVFADRREALYSFNSKRD